MGKTVQLRADDSLQQILERIRTEVASEIKKKYGIEKITIFGTSASKILAKKYSGQKSLRFEIDKINTKEGVLRIL